MPTIIVAASENNVIGLDGDLPWRLSADLQRFKRLTMGHAMMMGRKTWDSIGRILPGRQTIVLTRQTDFECPGATVVHTLDDAFAAAGDRRPFIIGGAEIYRIAIPLATRIELTRVDATIKGDTLLPAIDWNQWECVDREPFVSDDRNNYGGTFESWVRRPLV